MTTTVNFARASTRQFFFLTLHVVETVVSVDSVETVTGVIGIAPNQATAEAYAQAIPTTTVED